MAENIELLNVASAAAKERGISFEDVLNAMEEGYKAAAIKKYGYTDDVVIAEINRKTGELKLFHVREVVENDSDVEDYISQVSLEEALLNDPEVKVGGKIYDELAPLSMDDQMRAAAQSAKSAINDKIKEKVSEEEYERFKNEVNKIVSGIVSRIEPDAVILLLGKTECVLPKKSLIPGDNYKVGDRTRALIEKVRRDNYRPQIMLSRTHPEFVGQLFTQEVPEVYDGVIKIAGIAREAGSKCKFAVYAEDSSIDPVGTCVGIKGARVQSIISELQGEKIDIIKWSPDPATFIINALSPTKILKVILDEDTRKVEVVVADDQLSLAIGRRGQNVRLAAELTKWKIDVLTEEKESKRRQEEFNQASKLFIDALNIEDVVAHLLASEGFNNIEEIAYVSSDEIASIEGFNNEIAEALQERAREYILEQEDKKQKLVDSLKLDKYLTKVKEFNSDILQELAKNNITTRDDLADLSTDEFLEILPNCTLSKNKIEKIIMDARAHWFKS